MDESLTFDQLKGLVDQALSLYILNINIISEGEPLLYPQIKDLIEYIYKRSRGHVRIKLTTSGALLGKLGFDFLQKFKIILWISLHAGKVDLWKEIHRPTYAGFESSFFELKKILKKLVTNGNEVVLHSVICKQNYLKLSGIVDYAIDIGCKNMHFAKLRKFEQFQLTKEEEPLLAGNLTVIKEKMNSNGIKSNLTTYRDYIAITPPPPKKPAEKKQVKLRGEFYKSNNCYIPWLMSFILSDGTIGTNCGTMNFGKITKRSLNQVWDEDYDNFRKSTSNISKQDYIIEGCDCNHCPHISMNVMANKYIKKILGIFQHWNKLYRNK